MISVHFRGKPFNITIIQVYAPTTNAEAAEVDQFYEDLQDLLELTPEKRGPFHHRGAGMQSTQKIPGVTAKFGFEIQNETEQRLIEFFQENALPTTQEMSLQTDVNKWSVPKSD